LRPIFPSGATFNIPAVADFDAIFMAQGTVILPPAAAAGIGRTFAIRALGALRVNCATSDTVEGTKTVSLESGMAEMFVSDGKDRWLSVADRRPVPANAGVTTAAAPTRTTTTAVTPPAAPVGRATATRSPTT
jgi:hypothetical protein